MVSPKVQDSDSDVGTAVAQARKAKELTQAELAGLVGLDRTAISKIEGGQRQVSSIELARLSAALGKTMESFHTVSSTSRATLQSLRRKRRSIMRIARKHGARSVRVFGSAVRDEGQSDSDFDLLVEMEPGRGLLDQAALINELEDLLGRSVDVVTVQGLRERIRDEVLEQAVAL